MNNVGVFVCTGCEIGAAIDLENFEDVGSTAGASSYHTHENLCSPEGVALIQSAIDEGTDGVVIAACSHRAKIEEFNFDRTKVYVERVSLREQVAWCQPHGEEDTQMLAEDLLRMGVARAKIVSTPVPLSEDIDRTVLVVGGGLAGLEAAQAAAGMGNPVVLVESEDKLGGYVATMKDVVPEIPPYDTIHANRIGDLIAAVESNPGIKVFKSTLTKKIDGQPGQFDVELEGPGGSESMRVGAIVQATGAQPYDAARLSHLGYAGSPDVVTTQELEKMLVSGELHCPSNGKMPQRIVFVQCAGSRDPDHLP
jgi:quinone-modifying oxidoreductase subunit QmoB